MIEHSASTERWVISASKVASREPSKLRCGQPLLNRCQPRGSRHRSEAKKKRDSLELEASSTRYVREDRDSTVSSCGITAVAFAERRLA